MLGEFKFGSVRLGRVGVPLLLLVAFVAAGLRVRESAAWVLIVFIAGNVVVWLLATHLQGRFLVPIIPAAALLVGGVTKRGWFPAVLAISLLSVPFTFASVYKRLTAEPARVLLTYHDPSFFLPEPLTKLLLASDRPVYLVGEVRAFLYPVRSDRLHYRSVFDVSSTKPFREAWLGAEVPADAIVVVAPGELERFEKTYRNLPTMPADWRGRPMFVTDAELKAFVPVE